MKVQSPISPKYVLSILAPSYLATHQWGKSLGDALVSLGCWSEEVFRGDRLPLLPFPDPANPDHSPEEET
jgi:hypothetical protein